MKTYINFHFLVKAIVHDQTMGHTNPVGLHWMPSDVGIVAHVRVVKICYTFLMITIGERLIKRGERCHGVRCLNQNLFAQKRQCSSEEAMGGEGGRGF